MGLKSKKEISHEKARKAKKDEKLATRENKGELKCLK